VNKKKLPFQVRLTDVSDIAPRAGLVKGQICDVYAETRDGFEIWCDNYGMPIEMLYSECEKIVPEIETDKKGDSNVK
jgi:hypothetical protein